MTIVILDESKKRKKEMQDLLTAKGHTVIACSGSNEFIDVIQNNRPDRVFIDVQSWYHGRAIFNFIKFQKKMEAFPVIFYNAPTHYRGLAERTPHPHDKVFAKDKPVDLLISEGV